MIIRSSKRFVFRSDGIVIEATEAEFDGVMPDHVRKYLESSKAVQFIDRPAVVAGSGGSAAKAKPSGSRPRPEPATVPSEAPPSP